MRPPAFASSGELEEFWIPVSGYRVTPVLAIAARRPHVIAAQDEVAEVLWAPVDAFLPDAPIEIVETTVDRSGDFPLRFGAYPVAGHRVWGATARILGQLGRAPGLIRARATPCRRDDGIAKCRLKPDRLAPGPPRPSQSDARAPAGRPASTDDDGIGTVGIRSVRATRLSTAPFASGVLRSARPPGRARAVRHGARGGPRFPGTAPAWPGPRRRAIPSRTPRRWSSSGPPSSTTIARICAWSVQAVIDVRRPEDRLAAATSRCSSPTWT